MIRGKVFLKSYITFNVTATGPGLTYQWRKNGVNIAGAIASSYTTPTTTTANDGAQFSVVATDSCGKPVTSANAKLTLNTITVNSSLDSGSGTLRAAIATICSGGKIVIGPSVSLITLTAGPIVIGKNLTIQGQGEDLFEISGNAVSRVFQINAGATVQLQKMTITDGAKLHLTPHQLHNHREFGRAKHHQQRRWHFPNRRYLLKKHHHRRKHENQRYPR